MLMIREAQIEDADLLRSLLHRSFGEYDGRLDPPSAVHLETTASLGERIERGDGEGSLLEQGRRRESPRRRPVQPT